MLEVLRDYMNYFSIFFVDLSDIYSVSLFKRGEY